MKKSPFLLLWLPMYLYMGFIFALSSFSLPPFESKIINLDKLLHAIEYAILGWLVMRAFWSSAKRLSRFYVGFLAFLAASFYGATDEIHQFFVPGRLASIVDFGFDCLGSCLGVVIFAKSRNYVRDKTV